MLVVVGVILVVNFMKATNRRRRANQPPTPGVSQPVNHQQPGRPQQNGSRQNGTARPQPGAPYVGTLLNGIPMNTPGTLHGQQGAGFANERMRAEAELKRQLDALDAARRSGQVTADQYAAHREAIFKNF
ncbi:hypothetical protein AL755_06795 [Arthrobacter sp. ERGS1:01]|nr:hypothetical protein AL755_06795 [Arthrobacter sp. ERGS1:01]